MAHKLYLFKNVTPNITGHEFYNIKVFENYLNALKNNSNYFVKEINADNYRINALVCKITKIDFDENILTYLIEYDEVTGFKRCYYVDKINMQSNMLVMNLSIDYWGSYYLSNLIDYLHITRCNRNIGTGFYDNINFAGIRPLTYEEEINAYEFITGENLPNQNIPYYWNSLTKVSLVILLSYNQRQSVFTEDKVTVTELFEVDLSTLKNNLQLGITANVFKEAVEFVSEIIGVTGNGGIVDAEVLQAYFVPRDFVNMNTTNIIEVQAKDYQGNTKKVNFIGLNYYRSIREFEIEIDPNYDYILGTYRNNGLKLTRATKNIIVKYVCEATGKGLKIYVKEGENELAITNSFSFTINGSTTDTTGLRSVAHAISLVSSDIKQLMKSFSSGNMAGGIIGEVGNIAGRVQGFDVNTKLAGEGDALMTFNYLTNSYLQTSYGCPYCINKFKSNNNEKLHARYFGANFDEIFEDLDSIFDYDLLGEGDYNLTYIVVNEIKINNLPTIARETIETAFKTGVELYDYETAGN